MKVLVDTNVLIASDPTVLDEIEALTPSAMRFVKLANKHHFTIYVHPAQKKDILEDRNQQRKGIRLVHFEKYLQLKNPPIVNSELLSLLGEPRTSNDQVDLNLIQAIRSNAVDCIVTEDRGVRKRARLLGIEERVLSLPDILAILQSLEPTEVEPPPNVEHGPAYTLNLNDSIFDSFRADYPGFDSWLRQCQTEHRPSWLIRETNNVSAGVMIIKEKQDPSEYRLSGPTLKVCSLKVAAEFSRSRYGELLLKTIFRYANENRYGNIVITVKEKHDQLIGLLTIHGFYDLEITDGNGDRVLVKHLLPVLDPREPVKGFEYFLRYGPEVLPEGVEHYLVPILPAFHKMLFPERQKQRPLAGLELEGAYGNSIRKAYLSHSKIQPPGSGSVLWFYRSDDHRSISAAGVVESSFRSRSQTEITASTRLRTVYSDTDLADRCTKQNLVILFRQAKNIPFDIRLSTCNLSAPQSIYKLKRPAIECLLSQMNQ